VSDRKHTTSELLELGAPIVGTPLVLIARDAPSPRAAARIALYLGQDLQMAQATRWAAIVALRERNGDEKKGTFEQFFGPFDEGHYGELPDMRQKTLLQFEFMSKDEDKWQPLNLSEIRTVLDELSTLNKGRGVRFSVVTNPSDRERSRWPSKPRWEKDKR
jgi:hypothetical protein